LYVYCDQYTAVYCTSIAVYVLSRGGHFGPSFTTENAQNFRLRPAAHLHLPPAAPAAGPPPNVMIDMHLITLTVAAARSYVFRVCVENYNII